MYKVTRINGRWMVFVKVYSPSEECGFYNQIGREYAYKKCAYNYVESLKNKRGVI